MLFPLYHKQSRRQTAGQIACLLALGLVLAGCGKKPGHVDPPLGVSPDPFPQTYPDPATDPKPEPDTK